MTRKFILSSFLFFAFTVAEATTVDPGKTVDPEKEKEKSSTVEEVKERNTEKDFQYIKGELIEIEPVKKEAPEEKSEVKKPVQQTNTSQVEDVQSFNFLYYIIHQFKFSDFITQ